MCRDAPGSFGRHVYYRLVISVIARARPHDLILSAYKAYFFGMANVDDPFAMSNVLSTAGLLAIIINSLIVVRYGRRRVLLMTGLMICGVLQLIIAIVYQEQPGTTSTGKTIVALSCIYMFSYNGKISFGTSRVSLCFECPTNNIRHDCHVRLALRR